MSPYAVVLSALTADAGVTALVPADRMFRHYVREQVNGQPTPMPALSYRRASTEYIEIIHSRPPAARVTFEITCVADSEDEIERLGDALELIDEWRVLNREDLADPDTQEFGTVITVLVTVNIDA